MDTQILRTALCRKSTPLQAAQTPLAHEKRSQGPCIDRIRHAAVWVLLEKR